MAIQQRLLFGDWDYSNDIDSMFKYEDLLKLMDKDFNLGKEKYITRYCSFR